MDSVGGVTWKLRLQKRNITEAENTDMNKQNKPSQQLQTQTR